MSRSKELYERNIASLNNIDIIYQFMDKNAPLVDSSYLLRAKYVLIISAFDTYMHEIIIDKACDLFFTEKIPPDSVIELPLNKIQNIMKQESQIEQQQILIAELKRLMSSDSFQSPKSIEYALSLLGIKKPWVSMSEHFGIPGKDIHDTLALIVNRRNKIAHESDIDPQTKELIDIDYSVVSECSDFISKLVTEIDYLISNYNY